MAICKHACSILRSVSARILLPRLPAVGASGAAASVVGPPAACAETADAMPDAALAAVSADVLAAWSAEQRERAANSRILSAAALVALGLGFAGGSLSSAPAQAAPSLSPFATTALAPSDLLDPR